MKRTVTSPQLLSFLLPFLVSSVQAESRLPVQRSQVTATQTQAVKTNLNVSPGLTPQATSPFTPECLNKLRAKGIWPEGNFIFYEDELSGQWNQVPLMQLHTLLPHFKALDERFKELGTQLILVPMPARPLHLLNSFTAPPALQGEARAYHDFVMGAQRAGMNALNALTLLDGQPQLFFSKDIHWKPEGAQRLAQAAAQRINDLNLKGARVQSFYRIVARVQFDETKQPVLKTIQQQCGLQVPSEQYNVYTFRDSDRISIRVENFSVTENDHRWSLGPRSFLHIHVPQSTVASFKFAWRTAARPQQLSVHLNGSPIFSKALRGTRTSNDEINLPLKAGNNTLSFDYAYWNEGTTLFAQNDTRKLAVDFTQLLLTFPDFQYDAVSSTSIPVDTSDLLDDVNVPVVVVGSSFSLPNLAFSQFIHHYSQFEVLNASIGGGGAFSALKDLLYNGTFKAVTPQVIVWEFPLFGGDDHIETQLKQILGGTWANCTAEDLNPANLDLNSLKARGVKALRFDAPPPTVQLNFQALTPQGTIPVTLVNSLRMQKKHTFTFDLTTASYTKLSAAPLAGLSISTCR